MSTQIGTYLDDRHAQTQDLPPFELRVLDISGNAVGHQGALMIACFIDARKSAQQLQELVIDACGITDIGGAAVVCIRLKLHPQTL